MNTLFCDDCLVVLKSFEDNSVDMILTSPPYDNLRTYNNSLRWDFDIFKDIAKELYRVLKAGGVIVWVVGDATINGSETGTSFKQALFFMELGLNLHDTMIYQKKRPPLTHNRYEQEFEYMFVFSKGKVKTFNPIMIPKRYMDTRKHKAFGREKNGEFDYGCSSQKKDRIKGNVWEYRVSGGQATKDKEATKHPAIFPEQLARDHIISWSNKGDTILDPFMGSGTVGKMCCLLERNFIGIEIVPEYFEIAQKRINEYSNLLI